jgi:hypothetical protein
MPPDGSPTSEADFIQKCAAIRLLATSPNTAYQRNTINELVLQIHALLPTMPPGSKTCFDAGESLITEVTTLVLHRWQPKRPPAKFDLFCLQAAELCLPAIKFHNEQRPLKATLMARTIRLLLIHATSFVMGEPGVTKRRYKEWLTNTSTLEALGTLLADNDCKIPEDIKQRMLKRTETMPPAAEETAEERRFARMKHEACSTWPPPYLENTPLRTEVNTAALRSFRELTSAEKIEECACAVCGMRVQLSSCKNLPIQDFADTYGDLLQPSDNLTDHCPSVTDFLQHGDTKPELKPCNGLLLEPAGCHDNKLRVCEPCLSALQCDNIPKNSIANDNFVGPHFEALQGLTLAERFEKLTTLTLHRYWPHAHPQSHTLSVIGT